ncbi:MAG: site-specific integrase, partial [Planctomycetota bacterium]
MYDDIRDISDNGSLAHASTDTQDYADRAPSTSSSPANDRVGTPPDQQANGQHGGEKKSTAETPQDKQVSDLAREFLDHLKLERHFSDYTVRSYGADLTQFCQFLMGEIGRSFSSIDREADARPIDVKLVDVEADVVREFLAYLAAQNYTKSTTARKLATLRSFY